MLEDTMKSCCIAIAAIVIPLALEAQTPPAPPAGPPANPVTAAFRSRINGLHRNLAQAFDSIPESKFSYKPTPAQLSIGYVAQHIANDNYLFCNNFGSMKGTRAAADTTTADSVKATWPKATLVAKLKESFTFCEQALDQVDDAKLADQIQFSFGRNPPRALARASMVIGHALDLADHYSQIANYMRLNGMLPPTALPRPRPPGS
jgi:hypothetical protein